jgi:hypothetical protein
MSLYSLDSLLRSGLCPLKTNTTTARLGVGAETPLTLICMRSLGLTCFQIPVSPDPASLNPPQTSRRGPGCSFDNDTRPPWELRGLVQGGLGLYEREWVSALETLVCSFWVIMLLVVPVFPLSSRFRPSSLTPCARPLCSVPCWLLQPQPSQFCLVLTLCSALLPGPQGLCTCSVWNTLRHDSPYRLISQVIGHM